MSNLINILHGFQGKIPEYLPQRSVISPDAEGKQYVIYEHNIFKEIKAIYKRSYFINNCMF